MIYGEILAGGSGTRMGNTEMPKQYLMLGDRPIIIHTIEQFLINQSFSKIIVCCPKEWVSYTEDLLEKYNIDTNRVDIAVGGSTRNETIMNGCKLIEEKYGLTDKDIIVTHDAVRPFVNQRILDDNIKLSKKYAAIDTVVSATDTIVYSKDGKIISDIPNRKECFQGQTPQTFNIKKLIALFSSLTVKEKEILTDGCKIFSLKGESVGLVDGEVYNIKLTTLYDLKIAKAILMEKDEK